MTAIKAYLQLPGAWSSAVIDRPDQVATELANVVVRLSPGRAELLATLIEFRERAVRSEIWIGFPPSSALLLSWFSSRDEAASSLVAGSMTTLANRHGLVVERRVRDLGQVGAGAVYVIDRGDGADTLVIDAVALDEQDLPADLSDFDLAISTMEWSTLT